MSRLIDADKLKAHYAWWKGGSREMTMDEAKSDFDVIIDLQPTVYAEPKHGRWIFNTHYGEYQCSECTHEANYYERYNEDGSFDLIFPNYCGYCGARIDEVEE